MPADRVMAFWRPCGTNIALHTLYMSASQGSATMSLLLRCKKTTFMDGN